MAVTNFIHATSHLALLSFKTKSYDSCSCKSAILNYDEHGLKRNPGYASTTMSVAVIELGTQSQVRVYVTGFVKINPNHTGTKIHFVAELLH